MKIFIDYRSLNFSQMAKINKSGKKYNYLFVIILVIVIATL